MPPKSRPRTVVYIDGFNLYYGAVKDTPYKWLNLQRFCVRLRNDDDVVAIKYFTSRVKGGLSEPNQFVFLQALDTLPLVRVIQGHFKRKSVLCSHRSCQFTGDRHFETPEEKRTDVNIAVHMVDDAYRDECHNLVLISGDSDLVPAVHMVRQRFPHKRVIVYCPSKGRQEDRRAYELKQAATDGRDLPIALLGVCQFPQSIKGRAGQLLTKPATWP